MDPPPFWFEVHPSAVIYGPELPNTVRAVTISHYGMVDRIYGAAAGEYLLKLHGGGNGFQMPRYAQQPVYRDRSGAAYLVLRGDGPIHWLPCTVMDLREELIPDEIAESVRIPRAEFDGRFGESPAREFYRVTEQGAVPRYTIRVDRILDLLAKLAPAASQLNCETR